MLLERVRTTSGTRVASALSQLGAPASIHVTCHNRVTGINLASTEQKHWKQIL